MVHYGLNKMKLAFDVILRPTLGLLKLFI